MVRAYSKVQKNGRRVGRNAPCPCGSGRKYKKCCGDSTRLHVQNFPEVQLYSAQEIINKKVVQQRTEIIGRIAG